MKTSAHATSALQCAVLALTLAVFPTLIRAEEPATAAAQAGAKAADKTAEKLQNYKTTHSEMSKTEVKDAFEQIDAELNHLDQLAEAAPTSEQRAEVRTHYDVLKQRRNELKQDFTRARYDAFKADLRAEVDKVSDWAKETFTDRPAARSAASAAHDTADTASKKIADYRTDSTDVNKTEVKAALSRLDSDIEMLSVRIDAVNDVDRKAELKRRLEAYKDRRSELNSEFRQARYEALVADVKAEWNQLIH